MFSALLVDGFGDKISAGYMDCHPAFLFVYIRHMIYSLSGTVLLKHQSFLVVGVHGVGYKVSVPARVYEVLPVEGDSIFLYCYSAIREDAQDLYGFLREHDLMFFEKLLTVNGVGPKSALAIMGLSEPEELAAAITEGRADIFMRAAGVGKKTAERAVLELQGKLPAIQSEAAVARMEGDRDVEDALVGLGYARHDAKRVVAHIDKTIIDLESRLRAALKVLKK